MTDVRAVLDEAGAPREPPLLCAADFQVRSRARTCPSNVLRDVLELNYFDSLTEIDRFEITVNNWEPTTRRFNFIGSEAADYMTSGDAATRLYRCSSPARRRSRSARLFRQAASR